MKNTIQDINFPVKHIYCIAPCIFLSILCAGLCIPGPSSYKSIFMVYTERRVRVSCSVYDMLHADTKGYIISCKLVKLAYCLYKMLVFVVIASIHSVIEHNLGFDLVYISQHCFTVY